MLECCARLSTARAPQKLLTGIHLKHRPRLKSSNKSHTDLNSFPETDNLTFYTQLTCEINTDRRRAPPGKVCMEAEAAVCSTRSWVCGARAVIGLSAVARAGVRCVMSRYPWLGVTRFVVELHVQVCDAI